MMLNIVNMFRDYNVIMVTTDSKCKFLTYNDDPDSISVNMLK